VRCGWTRRSSSTGNSPRAAHPLTCPHSARLPSSSLPETVRAPPADRPTTHVPRRERCRTVPLKDRAWQIPLRLVSGVYIVGSASATPTTRRRSTCSSPPAGAYPFLADIDPPAFARVAVVLRGTARATLLVPRAAARAAGTGRLAFGVGLVGLCARRPGMRRPGSPSPIQQGLALSKDSWLAATGAALVLGDRPGSERRVYPGQAYRDRAGLSGARG
jgi:hypothetical protein